MILAHRTWLEGGNPSLAAPLRREPALWPPVGHHPPAPTPSAPAAQAPFQGADLWAAWHSRALTWAGGDDTKWINEHVLLRLPCGECSRHAKEYVASNPPTFAPGLYFLWTVAFHNAVNRRLGRGIWSIEQARSWWSDCPGSLTPSSLP